MLQKHPITDINNEFSVFPDGRVICFRGSMKKIPEKHNGQIYFFDCIDGRFVYTGNLGNVNINIPVQ